MITCPQCNAHYSAAQRFCSGCGHNLAQRCMYCGGAYLEGDQFCAQCGQDLNPPDSADQSTPDHDKESGPSSDFYRQLLAEAETDKKLFTISASNLSRKAIDNIFQKNEGSEQ